MAPTRLPSSIVKSGSAARVVAPQVTRTAATFKRKVGRREGRIDGMFHRRHDAQTIPVESEGVSRRREMKKFFDRGLALCDKVSHARLTFASRNRAGTSPHHPHPDGAGAH